MTPRPIRILHDTYASEPGVDTAVSRALLLRASQGEVPETLRLHVPGRIVAFGKRDTLEPGYAAAVAASRARGYTPIERLAGGRAAVFTELTVAFAWTIPDPDPRSGIYERFDRLARIMVGAFSRLGVAGSVGQIPGEYCPGDYSVHHGGRIKLMGVGQRLARHAAHVGGVVAVQGSHLIRDVLEAVYAALELPWEPTTAGALDDVRPGITTDDAIAAVLDELGESARLVPGALEPATLAMARDLAADHVALAG